MAFVSSVSISVAASAFHGRPTQSCQNAQRAQSPRARAPSAPAMKFDFGTAKTLEKYEPMSAEAPAEPTEAFWATSGTDTLLRKYARMNGQVEQSAEYPGYMNFLRTQIKLQAAPGYTAVTSAADAYMAGVVSRIYKSSACASGVYSVLCTEGVTRGQAELSRTASLASDFRLAQRSALHKLSDLFETRRAAVRAAHGCSYEERLNVTYAATGAALVRGESEAKATCARYATGADAAEEYMVDSVDKQSKARAVPFGVYDVVCADGSVSGMAENKRIVALSAKFRFGQVSELAMQQAKFDASKYARDNFAHLCSYEEDLFNRFPVVARAMRSPSAQYT